MALRFLAIDPDTDDDGSPTFWLDEENGDLIIQSYIADGATLAMCAEAGSAPGHSTEVPPNETVIRLPQRMLALLPRT